ncbi:HEAT repeat domain-containing protein [Tengunoibacter tsumagoiensis]|uniref:Uncharacterized protein n=1 Tax=Tengunoibacter tsumagoiensis TaxID=2014871 RepID=A0A402AAS2_9CHLR|nr:HEAT repeat domain-containing protein [Tengunoibacter tsumagoiensis]GCE16045.1 hypothetical protein KTT_59040 [Tengunoibacter tsumagoiensis]
MFHWLNWQDTVGATKNEARLNEQAFWLVHMEEYASEMERFQQRWGGCQPESCLNVLQTGDRLDRCVALCIIAASSLPEARQIVASGMRSSSPQERWCSTLCLSEMGDEEAIPDLCSMLTEFLPQPCNPWPQKELQWWFEDRRLLLPRAVRRWQCSNVTQALFAAFQRQVNVEVNTFFNENYCLFYEDYLAYELGFRGDFSGVIGVTWSLAHLRRAVMLMALGCYDALCDPGQWDRTGSYDDDRAYNQALRPHLCQIIHTRLGWSEAAANDCFDHAYEDFLAREYEAQTGPTGQRKQIVTQWLAG